MMTTTHPTTKPTHAYLTAKSNCSATGTSGQSTIKKGTIKCFGAKRGREMQETNDPKWDCYSWVNDSPEANRVKNNFFGDHPKSGTGVLGDAWENMLSKLLRKYHEPTRNLTENVWKILWESFLAANTPEEKETATKKLCRNIKKCAENALKDLWKKRNRETRLPDHDGGIKGSNSEETEIKELDASVGQMMESSTDSDESEGSGPDNSRDQSKEDDETFVTTYNPEGLDYGQMRDMIRRKYRGHDLPTLIAVIDALEDGCITRSQIAEYVGITPKRYSAIKRTLMRIFSDDEPDGGIK